MRAEVHPKVDICLEQELLNLAARTLVKVKSDSAGKGRHAAKFTQSAKGSWEISGRTGMDR